MADEPKVCPTCGTRYDAAAIFCQLDGASLAVDGDAEDPYLGQVLLDQFIIEERIGSGGMGAVYRARQTTLDRDVAIKILHGELVDNDDAVRRFQREAKITTALDHPNVVNVFLFGQLDDGSLYLVMEYLKGESLLERIREDGAMPLGQALHIAVQICDGVAEAHSRGIVHRDVKPENVLVVQRGHDPDFVKVLDFGIARLLWDEQTVHTQSGLIFGTARYISPEGAAGEATDSRSDVYSIGVLIYQLLAGRTPFEADSPVSMLMKHINEVAPDIRLSTPAGQGVPDAVAEVIMRSLDKDPASRFLDAGDLAAHLRHACAEIGIELTDARYRPSMASELRRSSLPAAASISPSSAGSLASMSPGMPGESMPPLRATPSAKPVARSSSVPGNGAYAGHRESATLANAPDPFNDSMSLRAAGLPTGGGRRFMGLVVAAFVIGAGVVVGVAYQNGWLKPAQPEPAPTAAAPADENADTIRADEDSTATAADSDALPTAVGIHFLPSIPEIGQPTTLLGVFESSVPIAEQQPPTFTVTADGRSDSVEAHLSPDGHTWLASYVFRRAESYTIVLRQGEEGSARAEISEVLDLTQGPAARRAAARHRLQPASGQVVPAPIPPSVPGDMGTIGPAHERTERGTTRTPDGIDWTAPTEPWPGARSGSQEVRQPETRPERRVPGRATPAFEEEPPPPWTGGSGVL